MHGQTLVAIYGSRADAERTRDRLREAGIPDSDIRVSAADSGTPGVSESAVPDNSIAPRAHGDGGFLDWLFGSDVSENDRTWYASNLKEGRTAVSVYLRDETNRQRVEDVLEQSDPIDIDQEGLGAVSGTGTIGQAATTGVTAGTSLPTSRLSTDATTGITGADVASRRAEADLSAGGVRAAAAPAVAAEGEQVIPVAKEEIEIGKRTVERRRRIRVHVVERPVEEQVTLHDERVSVERRPVSGERTVPADALQEREIEVTERHEEPVVEKTARTVEEVVIHREAAERVETVRDTVRETKVDVDREASGTAGLGRREDLGIDRAAAGSKPGTTLDGETVRDDRSLGERISDKAHDLKEDAKDAVTPTRKP